MFDKSALREIQGNIAEGYRLSAVAHLFGTVSADLAGQWRKLLDALIDDVTPAEEWHALPPWTLNVGLSHAGLAALEPELARDMQPHFGAFAQGMSARAVLLGDTSAFEGKSWSQHHVWLAVHAADRAGLAAQVKRFEALAATFDLTLDEETPWGEALTDPRDKTLTGREHFGFRDNISNPALAEWPRRGRRSADEYYAGRGKYVDGAWVGIAPGEFLLGYANEAGEDPMSGIGAPARRWLKNATFGVLRKLSQDVAGFRRYLASHETPEAPAAYLASKMMGRTYDGVPVGCPNADYLQKFTYEYDEHGSGCPLGAHVRRANPRSGGRHRLLRRGMTYGPELAEGERDDGEQRGIWFVGFNACIEDQFELIQRQWLNAPFGTLSDAGDPIGSTQASRNFVIEGDRLPPRMPRLLMGIPRFVTCLGGEYYLVPSKAALRQLAQKDGYLRSELVLEQAS